LRLLLLHCVGSCLLGCGSPNDRTLSKDVLQSRRDGFAQRGDNQALRALQRLGYKQGEDPKRLTVVKLTLEEIRRETEGVTFL
jgi:hypothetical protein